MSDKEFTALERAAILLMSLPPEVSSLMLKHLDPKQVQLLGSAMAKVDHVDKNTRDVVLTEFLKDANNTTSLGIGANSYIKKVMNNVLGPEKAEHVLDNILPSEQPAGLDMLQWMEPQAIFSMIQFEHPQVQCIILSHLSPEHSASILTHFKNEEKLDLILRMAKLENITPEAIVEINELIQNRSGQKAVKAPQNLSGIKSAANILNFLDKDVEAAIIESITDNNPELCERIQDQMFVFENLLDIDDRGIQTLLREVSTDMLVFALKGTEEEMQDKIFNNMSKRAAQMLKDDLESKGPVKISEVEAAQKEVINIAKRMAENGEIMLGGGGAEAMI